ncbi:hypothetical protein EMCRGX_G030782 [Ephydatia muelleri]
MQRRAEDELPSVGITQKKVEPQARYSISVSVTPEPQKVADSLVSFPRSSSQQGTNSTASSQPATNTTAGMAAQMPLQQTTLPQTQQSSPGSQSQGTAPATSTIQQQAAAVASSQFQRLKVEDALSYLDQVKLQFGNQPQVYNDFLDIMKEFKSQSIDTPGVISRVSNLFKGHPDLIVGFNTFLPPGFKIEVNHNEINISGPAQHTHALQRIAMQHNSANAAAALAAQSAAQSLMQAATTPQPTSTTTATSATQSRTTSHTPVPSHSTHSPAPQQTTPHQPVEFNHAINYVNKIKNRFQNHPDIYKAFLEILHTYQKEQRLIKEGGGKPNAVPLTETEVYAQVSKLFQNQEDLLSEFGQFLPDATGANPLVSGSTPAKKQSLGTGTASKGSKPLHGRRSSQSSSSSQNQGKIGQGGGREQRPKNSAKDILAEAGKHTNYAELALFDKIHKALRNQEVYDNFLRCLILFNEEIVTRSELVQLVTPFLGKFPDLFSSFKSLLGFRDPDHSGSFPISSPAQPYPNKERVNEFGPEIDFNSLKRHGASYRALPKTYVQPKCSGRSALCREVLNDTWVSFPMWSEDSTFQGTRKTQYEEYIYRCEDERFELDAVLENNLSTIRIFEAQQRKISKMSPEEASKCVLDDSLGGRSEVLQRKAIYRIYGDKAADIVEGLKKSPAVAVPIVLKRLKAKQEEWLEAQRAFNKHWREQLEKYYLKSLDHQGINFKAIDTRAMRPKSLVNEIEIVFDERQEQLAEGASVSGPHLELPLPEDKCVFNDAVSLVMYYIKRASSVPRDEALKIRSFLTHTLADLFFYPHVEVSSEDDLSPESDLGDMEVDEANPEPLDHKPPSKNDGVKFLVPDVPPYFSEMDYHLIFTNSSLYTLFRLFQFLCERLSKLHQQALQAIADDERTHESRTSSVAAQLGLKKPSDIQVEDLYPTFLNMAKNFMEGNIDSNTFEDTCREMFGVRAYTVFTIDRLIQNTVRQLHTIVTEEGSSHVMELYASHIDQLLAAHLKASSRTTLEAAYQKRSETLLTDDSCFKVMVYNPREHKLTVELLDTDISTDDGNCLETKKWSNYVEMYSKTDQYTSPDIREILAQRKVYLNRNCRLWPASSENGEEEEDTTRLLGIHLPDMEIVGAIEFKMDKKSYRMIPLANSEDYLYNRQSLTKAKEMNRKIAEHKHQKFDEWHQKWLESCVTEEDSKAAASWLKGEDHSDASLSSTDGSPAYENESNGSPLA